MKLKETWMGICVWVLYLGGIIFALEFTGLISGLFPSYGNFPLAYLTAPLALLAAGIVFLLGKLLAGALRGVFPNSLNGRIQPVLEVMLPVIVLVISFLTFSYYSTLYPVSGSEDLLSEALVTKSSGGVSFGGLLENVYVTGLNWVMRFLGNTPVAAVVYQFAIRMATVLFLYIALRLSIGVLGAVTGSVLMAAIPYFGYSITELSSKTLLSMTFVLEAMLVVIYVRVIGSKSTDKLWTKLVSAVMGFACGALLFFDAGMVAFFMFLIAAFFMVEVKDKVLNVVVNEIAFLIFGAFSFTLMLGLECGFVNMQSALLAWRQRFFYVNSKIWEFVAGGLATTKIMYIALLAVALISVFAVIKKEGKRRPEKLVPWMLVSLLSVVLSGVLGDTYLNSEFMLYAVLVIMVSCSAASLVFNYDAELEIEDEEYEEYEEEEIEEDEEEAEEESRGFEVVEPDVRKNSLKELFAENSEAEEETAISLEPHEWKPYVPEEEDEDEEVEVVPEEEPEEEAFDEEPEEETFEEDTQEEAEEPEEEAFEETQEEVEEPEEEVEESEDIPEEVKEEPEEVQEPAKPLEPHEFVPVEEPVEAPKEEPAPKKLAAPRFVPEGMVLPVGDEDEEDLVPRINLRRQEMEDIGIISLNRGDQEIKEETKEEPSKPKKDDFDIDIEDGDDFDI